MDKTKGEKCVCPHCFTEQEEPIEDFSIPGRIGSASRAATDCFDCSRLFTVEEIAKDQFRIYKGDCS